MLFDTFLYAIPGTIVNVDVPDSAKALVVDDGDSAPTVRP